MLPSCEKQNLLVEIKIHYGLNEDAKSLIERYFKLDDETSTDESLQECLKEFILDDPVLLEFPPSRSYRSRFLKYIISYFETQNWELDESILERYITLINENQINQSQTHFIVFFLKVFNFLMILILQEFYFLNWYISKKKDDISKKPVVVEQNSSIISDGTTGLHTWPACYRMIEFLMSNKSGLLNKKLDLY